VLQPEIRATEGQLGDGDLTGLVTVEPVQLRRTERVPVEGDRLGTVPHRQPWRDVEIGHVISQDRTSWPK
jgi:hypothetical protein